MRTASIVAPQASSSALLALTWFGGSLWSAAYAWAIYVGYREGVSAFPVPAILLNLTWEILFTLWRPPRRSITKALYWTWLLLDVGLWLQLFFLATPPEFRGIIGSHEVFWLVPVSLGVLYLQRHVHARLRAPHLQAYLVNFVVSGLFLWMFVARTEGQALSLGVGWLKCLGTFAISVANVCGWCESKRVHGVGLAVMVGITLMDVTYLTLLSTR